MTQVKKYLGTYPSLYPLKGKDVSFSSEKLADEGYDPELDSDCVGYVSSKMATWVFRTNLTSNVQII